jgi:hypothetical protein
MKTQPIIITLFAGLLWVSASFAEPSLPPLSATYEVSLVKQLSGGNRIDKTVAGKYFRDSRGRTRLEMGGKISISDPAKRIAIFLDPANLTAKRVMLPVLDRSASGRSNSTTSPAPKPLGSRWIEGFETIGNEHTYTLPAGVIGNTAPIQQKVEVWISEELKVPLLTISRDEVGGDRTQAYRMIQKVSQLDESLFAIPSGYKIEDVSAPPASVLTGSTPPTPNR